MWRAGLLLLILAASYLAGIQKRVTYRTLRHSFAPHRLEVGWDIRAAPEPLGHKDVRTAMIYTHALNRDGRAACSSADP